MDNRPLSYGSLKAIIKHLDPNLRLKIGQLIPSMKKIEKLFPLKIDYLEFNRTGLTVNDTKYCFTLHIEPHKDSPDALNVWIRNLDKGEDLDEFGSTDFSCNILSTGDIVVDQGSWMRNIERASRVDEHFASVEQVLTTETMMIKSYSEKVKEMSIYLEETRRKRENGEKFTAEDEREFEKCEMFKRVYSNSIIEREAGIVTLLEDYPTFCYHRDRVQPPYDAFLQFVINKPTGTEILRKPYDQRIHEVLKKLIIDLFGGRDQVIHVKTLKINRPTILRLPENVKFRAKNIDITGIVSPMKVQMDALDSIIDKSC